MLRNRRAPNRRGAFTLIELLVVIAIIAVLTGLISAAVMRIWFKGPIVQTRNDISQMDAALKDLMAEKQLKYIPSRLVLREDGNYNLSNAQHRETLSFLQRFFNKRVARRGNQINWNGNRTIETTDLILEGQEVLVFVLGGIPTQQGAVYGVTGFSTGLNPSTPGGERAGPYFQFQSKRLKPSIRRHGFLVYEDAYGKGIPYAYLSSYKAGNDYRNDCPGLRVLPYREPGNPVRFVNPKKFQIISAGADGVFGTNNTWDPRGGKTGAGADNQANFATGILSAGE